MTFRPPWRLGAPSFVYPAGWLENVERLGPEVDDVEILFFEADTASSFPNTAELRGLLQAKKRHQLTYTLHTPLSASLASESAARRAEGIAQVCRALEIAQPLQPERVVVHVYLGDHEGDTPPSDLDAWRARAADSLHTLLRTQRVAASNLCVECLDYDFALIAPVVAALDLRIALDVGHLMRDGRDAVEAFRTYGSRIRAIQWHGTDPSGRDHRSLAHIEHEKIRTFVRGLLISRFREVLTLEVFRPNDWESSRALLERWTRDEQKQLHTSVEAQDLTAERFADVTRSHNRS